jgi:hypothetical protein
MKSNLNKLNGLLIDHVSKLSSDITRDLERKSGTSIDNLDVRFNYESDGSITTEWRYKQSFINDFLEKERKWLEEYKNEKKNL